jgi:hypothetical protein
LPRPCSRPTRAIQGLSGNDTRHSSATCNHKGTCDARQSTAPYHTYTRVHLYLSKAASHGCWWHKRPTNAMCCSAMCCSANCW